MCILLFNLKHQLLLGCVWAKCGGCYGLRRTVSTSSLCGFFLGLLAYAGQTPGHFPLGLPISHSINRLPLPGDTYWVDGDWAVFCNTKCSALVIEFHYSTISCSLRDCGVVGESLCHYLIPRCSEPATAALVLITSYGPAKSPTTHLVVF